MLLESHKCHFISQKLPATNLNNLEFVPLSLFSTSPLSPSSSWMAPTFIFLWLQTAVYTSAQHQPMLFVIYHLSFGYSLRSMLIYTLHCSLPSKIRASYLKHAKNRPSLHLTMEKLWYSLHFSNASIPSTSSSLGLASTTFLYKTCSH